MINKALTASRKHAWSRDPAFDRSDPAKLVTAYRKFLEDGDLAGVPTREGWRPATFTLSPLTRRQVIHILALAAQTSGGERATPAADCEAVAYSLRQVEGFTVNGEGAVLAFEDAPGAIGGRRLSPATLDAIYDPHLFAELANITLEISHIHP